MAFKVEDGDTFFGKLDDVLARRDALVGLLSDLDVAAILAGDDDDDDDNGDEGGEYSAYMDQVREHGDEAFGEMLRSGTLEDHHTEEGRGG